MNALNFGKGIPQAAAVRVRAVARSHVGNIRKINEDRVFDGSDMRCWAVADGMGGHGGGDIAAQIVIDTLRAEAAGLADGPVDLVDVLGQANQTILGRNIAGGQQAGTTVVAAIAGAQAMRIVWAGDSRAYLIRAGHLTQLTHDHSLVQDLVDAGLLTAASAETHPQAHVVTRALGVGPNAELDQMDCDFLPGDRLLLCSDGLSRSLRADDLAGDLPIATLAARLLDKTLEVDGSDNISLVIVEAF